MFATGTIISNRRHFPEGLKAVNLHEVGSYRFAVCDKMMACVWHDRRNVTMLSTMHNTSVTTVLKRPKGKKDKQLLPCPSCIADYNEFMGGGRSHGPMTKLLFAYKALLSEMVEKNFLAFD